ncbi:MAG: sugar phosphate isomerase/epimerase [Fimbriimonadaceae bacterium]|nr:sugar phosphate isomerase/epimerase [Fimbriimonadaceae bacterium]
MAKVPIGLELYSVRQDLAQDTRGTLEAVAKMGYAGVEFAGLPQHPAAELKGYLDEFGLICCGWHTPIPLVLDDKLAATIEFNKTLGNTRIIIPGLPGEYTGSTAKWLSTAAFFNTLADRLGAVGMVTGYHNHHTEFKPFDDGLVAWDTFFGNTAPAVIMQLDMGNALAGGADLVAILKQYPGRAGTVHLKPYSPSLGKDDMHAGFRPLIGDDEVPWAAVFDLCETSGATDWYIVEYESDLFPPLEAVDRCLQNLRAMGK